MTYVTMHTLSGSPEELLARKKAHFDPVVRRLAPAFGALFSITAPTDAGLLIINVWQDAQRVSAFTAVPEMQAAQADAHLPPPSSFQRFPDALLETFQAAATPSPTSPPHLG